MTAARLTGCSLVLASGLASGQFALTYDPSPPLSRDGSSLPLAWAGGLNFVQVSDIDLDGDGDKDLFVFDRSGDEAVFLLNNGTSGTDGYTITHAYDHVYPFSTLENWALMRDYDGDGWEDLFAAVNAGFAVYRNVSGDGVLAFELIDDLVGSDYDPVYSPNINTYGTDVPGFADIDGDGDLDLLTFGIGNQLDYHSNQSVELYGHTDSLIYRVRNRCWGYFAESGSSSTIQLDYICAYNVEDPDLPVIGHGETTALDRADVGSTMLPIDLDGDGDKDLLIGDVQSPNIIALTNGGDQDSAYMVAQDPHFPAYDEPIELDRFVGTFYVDVDNDGVRDLLASPSFGGQSENLRSLWYYQNIGTDDVPVFSKRSENLFQRDMFDVGEGAWPVLFDFDGDSLMDLIVANYGYYSPDIVFPARLIALRNTGTATAPAFTVISEDYASLGSSGLGNAMYPAFGDLDGDGDKDLYVGDRQGRLHYFRNTATGPEAQFELVSASDTDQVGNIMDVGQFAAPQLFDVDADGLLDLLVGERNGNLNWFRNIGTATQHAWELANDSLGGFDVAGGLNNTGYSTPFMFQGEDGGTELVLGSQSGWIHHFSGFDGDLGGTWTATDTMWQGIDEGGRTGIVLHDFTGDGYLDAVIGNYRGGLSYWRNDHAVGTRDVGDAGPGGLVFQPNPAHSHTTVRWQGTALSRGVVEVFNAQGSHLHSQQLSEEAPVLRTIDLPNGVYLTRLSLDDQVVHGRFMVIHR